MGLFYKWSMLCTTEDSKGELKHVIQKEGFADPTECPTDPSHVIKEGSIKYASHVPVAKKTSAMLTPIKDLWRPTDVLGFREFVCAVIDVETKDRIAAGFEWPVASGKILSLSKEAQSNWLRLQADPTAPSYPLTLSTIDNSSEVSVADASAATNLAQTASAVLDSRITAGNSVKAAVRAAGTIDAVYNAVSSYLDGN